MISNNVVCATSNVSDQPVHTQARLSLHLSKCHIVAAHVYIKIKATAEEFYM